MKAPSRAFPASLILGFCYFFSLPNIAAEQVILSPVDVTDMNLRDFGEYQDVGRLMKEGAWGGAIRLVAKGQENNEVLHCVLFYWRHKDDGGVATSAQIVSWERGEESNKHITDLDEQEGRLLLEEIDASEFFSLCGNKVRRSLGLPNGGRVLYAEEFRSGETKLCARYISESAPARSLMEAIIHAVQRGNKQD